MIDFLTGAAAVALLRSGMGKGHLERLLGPSEDVLGEMLKGWTKQRIKKTEEILIAGSKMVTAPGETIKRVPPRVLYEIVENGSWSEDEITVQYFGGVLASSRTSIPRDDRGVTLAKLVTQMSSYQLRAHYVLYSMFKQTFSGKQLSVLTQADKMEMLVPYVPFNEAMEWTDDEDAGEAFAHLIMWLTRLDLANVIAAGGKEFLEEFRRDIPEGGLLVAPTGPGVELFLWAHGRSDVSVVDFLNSDVVLDPHIDIQVSNAGIPVPPPPPIYGV